MPAFTLPSACVRNTFIEVLDIPPLFKLRRTQSDRPQRFSGPSDLSPILLGTGPNYTFNTKPVCAVQQSTLIEEVDIEGFDGYESWPLPQEVIDEDLAHANADVRNLQQPDLCRTKTFDGYEPIDLWSLCPATMAQAQFCVAAASAGAEPTTSLSARPVPESSPTTAMHEPHLARVKNTFIELVDGLPICGELRRTKSDQPCLEVAMAGDTMFADFVEPRRMDASLVADVGGAEFGWQS